MSISRARRRGIECERVAAEAPDELDLLVDLVELVRLGRDPEHAVGLVAGVDPVAGERGVQLGERLRADALELVQLVLGEAHEAVRSGRA